MQTRGLVVAGLVGVAVAACSGSSGPTDAGDDATQPTASDTGSEDREEETGDSGTPAPVPAACDDPAAFVGEGADTLTVTGGAEFCVLSVAQPEEMVALRKVTVLPGSYAWPDAAGTGPYRLPLCVASKAGTTEGLRAGSVTYSSDVGLVTAVYRQSYSLGAKSESLELAVEQGGPAPPSPALDGQMVAQEGKSFTQLDLSVCSDEVGCWSLTPCATPKTGAADVLTFARGELALHLDVVSDGRVWIDPPRVLYKAEVALDGTTFAQESYFSLGYRYAAHGLDRELLVMFEEDPVSGACGIQGRYGRTEEQRLWLIDCDGEELEDLGSFTVTEGQ